MAIINLRDFYYCYIQDEFVEVPDEMAAELFTGKHTDKAHARRMRRNRVYSLNAGDGIEASAIVCTTDNPEAVFDRMERHCRLCWALNSLPETQGRRIEAHYILGKTHKEMTKAEGVKLSALYESIDRGLKAMRIYLENSKTQPENCPHSDLISE
jgi:RNA polymerase sigma-70 factor (ECF subfamily)